MQIFRVLQKGKADLQSALIPHPAMEAEILLLHAIGHNRSREWLIANQDFPINNETVKQFNNFLLRRSKFEPIAYITNHKEFYGYDFYVDNRVLVPRPESELLVEVAIKKIENRNQKIAQDWNVECRMSTKFHIPHSTFHILELGTGSGCIIISIIKELQKQKIDLSKFKIIATDISQDALDVAQKNARNLNVDHFVHFAESDLFDYFDCQVSGVRCQVFDIIIANLPYVSTYWLETSDWAKTLHYEPNVALDGGSDGLDVYQRFFQEVPKYLAKDGIILIECEDDQIDKILKILKDLKYIFSHQVFRDYNNLQRVIQIDKIKT